MLPQLLLFLAIHGAGDAPIPFWFHVVDEATGRGVPLVELETVHGVLFVTDSDGVAAIDEPSWTGSEMWFSVRSHGYEYPADGFGLRGLRVVVTPGRSREVKLRRINVAERLYRVTGADRYRDSRRVGVRAPTEERSGPPLGNGGVLGQDSVLNVEYGGRLWWIWGDTSRAAYPLGNFAASGARSRLPADGGLDPAVGVDLEYFVDEHGFSRAMAPLGEPGAIWLDGLVVLDGVMVCHYMRVKDLGVLYEHGLARWSDDAQRFEKLVALPIESKVHPLGHPVRHAERLWFGTAHPVIRVPARLDALSDPAEYEFFTCLRPGAHWNGRAPSDSADLLERDTEGGLVWDWKRDVDPVDPRQWMQLERAGLVGAEENPLRILDVETGEPIVTHNGNVCWNEHLGAWVMLFTEQFGRSMLGEVWFSTAPDLLGPWSRARRVVTHDDYSFYNVKQHPYFADGRYLYFEGTYTKAFSGRQQGTPRYDYNQVMYRLDLDDPRLR